MKRQLRGALLIGLLFANFANAEAAQTHTVAMKSVSYEPKSIEIKAGDSVIWKNVSYTEHSATSDEGTPADSPFDTGLVQPKKTSRALAFSKPGTYSYHCTLHGRTMSGRVVVTP